MFNTVEDFLAAVQPSTVCVIAKVFPEILKNNEKCTGAEEFKKTTLSTKVKVKPGCPFLHNF